jgi:hypothetical protein
MTPPLATPLPGDALPCRDAAAAAGEAGEAGEAAQEAAK